MSMPQTQPIDARGIPTTECPVCSSNIFKIVATFDPEDYNIGMYLLDAECGMCGTLLTAPTPLDHPEYEGAQDV